MKNSTTSIMNEGQAQGEGLGYVVGLTRYKNNKLFYKERRKNEREKNVEKGHGGLCAFAI